MALFDKAIFDPEIFDCVVRKTPRTGGSDYRDKRYMLARPAGVISPK
jgi:hypothetical protein